MSYPPELVLRVNEIFHDLEGREYENRHPEIFKGESARWQQIGRHFLNSVRNHPFRLLDVGSGTGFVPLQLGPFLKESDGVVCSDLSAEMLRVCQQNLSAVGIPCRREFL